MIAGTGNAKLLLISHTLTSSEFNIDISFTRTLSSKCITLFTHGEVTAGAVCTVAVFLGVPEAPRRVGARLTLISCSTQGTSTLVELVAWLRELVVVGHVNSWPGT